MNVNYKLSLNEYQEGVNFHYKNGKKPLLISLFIGLTTFLMLLGTDFSNNREVITNMIVVFFAISFYLLFTRMVTAYQAKKIYFKSPVLSNEVTLHVSGKGINQDKKSTKEILPWKIFSMWRENEKYYLLYTSAHRFNVIPKRVFSEKEEKEFRTYLEKYLGDSK